MPLDFNTWLKEQKRITDEADPMAINDAGRPIPAFFNPQVVQEIVNNSTFITEVINNEEFVTNLTEVEEFITNIFNSNTYITQIKGQPNGVPSLDNNGKVPKGQINPDYIENPMTVAGDTIYGGSGTPTGFVDVLDGLSGTGGGGVTLSTNSGAGGWGVAWTDGDRTTSETEGLLAVPGAWARVAFAASRRIGRFRFAQVNTAVTPNTSSDDPAIESSDDNVVWTTRWKFSVDGAPDSEVFGTDKIDYGVIDLPQPINARYWRLAHRGIHNAGNPWVINEFQLFEVETDGAGNPTRLGPPSERRNYEYDPSAGAPGWAAPSTANADTSGATLLQLETEVNELKAVLRAHGIIAN